MLCSFLCVKQSAAIQLSDLEKSRETFIKQFCEGMSVPITDPRDPS